MLPIHRIRRDLRKAAMDARGLKPEHIERLCASALSLINVMTVERTVLRRCLEGIREREAPMRFVSPKTKRKKPPRK